MHFRKMHFSKMHFLAIWTKHRSTHLLLMILEMTPSLDAVADPGWNILIFSVRYGLLKPLAEVNFWTTVY